MFVDPIRPFTLVDENLLIEVIIKYNGDIYKLENDLDIEIEDLGQNYAIVTLTRTKIPSLYSYSEVEYIEFPKLLYYSQEQGSDLCCVNPVKDLKMLALSGKGVALGIIDSGVDYTHPDFINEDGTTRFLALWDQTVEGTPPQGFKSGAYYSAEDINQALLSNNPFSVVPSQDFIGHGTSIAGVAGGNRKTK
ncbi:MAG: S8 family serine peptidase [Clostridia bacterium]|nr:S8 family serine peptidase [Clostridia bacterium]MDD4376093.1 S8 family serine peptidase [Clostridia bacterium]